MNKFIETLWYKKSRWFCLSVLLFPFMILYRLVVSVRRYVLSRFFQAQFSVPVIVVGNLTVGGVGKTPLVIAIARRFQDQGLRVGIVSRGYGAKVSNFPCVVSAISDPVLYGDEPVLIAKKTGCPVVISPQRVKAIQYLLSRESCDVIISDDGLQHYAMGRSIEIAVVDGIRRFGNQYCLPVGPLREPISRLSSVDFIIVNGDKPLSTSFAPRIAEYPMRFKTLPLRNVKADKEITIDVSEEPVAAVAAIGHPAQFYSMLRKIGWRVKEYSFPDHYLFQVNDLDLPEKVIIMTEKDAVKCVRFANERCFYYPIQAELTEQFWLELMSHPTLKSLFINA